MTRVISSVSKISERESPRSGGGVDPGRVEQSSVSPKSAPRGTASFSGPSSGAPPPATPGHQPAALSARRDSSSIWATWTRSR